MHHLQTGVNQRPIAPLRIVESIVLSSGNIQEVFARFSTPPPANNNIFKLCCSGCEPKIDSCRVPGNASNNLKVSYPYLLKFPVLSHQGRVFFCPDLPFFSLRIYTANIC